jgi:type I restriction enzyme S subunit
MKDMIGAFKETEIGPIPVDWNIVSLLEVTQKTKTRDPHKMPDKTFKYVDVSSVSNETYRVQGWQELRGHEAPSRARKVIKVHDTLFATVRPYLRNIAQVPSHLDNEICSTGFCVIRANTERAEPDYLYYVALSNAFVERIVAQQRGSSYPAVSDKVVLGELIPLPPLPEQRRIARVLSAIQRAIAAQDDLIAAARQVKRSMMERLFRYGPGAEPALTKETEFGPVPRHWDMKLLRKCAFVQTGAAKGRRFGDAHTITVPYLRVANVQDGYLDLSEIKNIRIKESEIERYSLQPGDVVLTEGGDFDKLGRGFIWRGQIPNCIHQNHIFAVRTEREILLPEYLAYLVQSDYGKAYFLKVAHRTTNLASINSTKLKVFPALVPHLDEQEPIVRILSTVDHKIAAEQQRKAALQELFKSTLRQLMTGQIRVRERAPPPPPPPPRVESARLS